MAEGVSCWVCHAYDSVVMTDVLVCLGRRKYTAHGGVAVGMHFLTPEIHMFVTG